MNYVEITQQDDTLTITLTEEGKNYALECIEAGMSHYELFYELMEYWLCNGYTLVNGYQIGGWLTDCDVLGEDMYHDDNGEVILSGNVYVNVAWYQVYSNLDMMLKGECIYSLVE